MALGSVRSRCAGLWLAWLAWGACIGVAQAGQGFQREVEPNNSAATATVLNGNSVVVLGYLFPGSDSDYYSFSAGAGDHVYAATMTAFASSAAFNTSNSVLDLIDTNGVTVLESDNDDGFFSATSSSIAGHVLPVAGTYFLRVTPSPATSQMRPYHLHFQLRSGTPTAETEPNGFFSAQALPASGWVSGAITSGDNDAFRVALNSGDTVFASLDLNPDGTGAWNGRVGLSAINETNPLAFSDDLSGGPPASEAFFWTVNASGNYDVYVDANSGAGANAHYNLSVSVLPNTPATSSCTTYASTGAVTIPTGPGLVSSTINVPGNPRIADLDVSIDLTHANLADLDVHLVSPAGNDNGLFSDLTGSTTMNLRFDDEAAVPPLGSIPVIGIYNGVALQPELNYRLSWFDGENAGGNWRLDIRDDTAANGGTLNAWSLTICQAAPICPAGTTPVKFFSQDFEANDGGFTLNPAGNEWGYGTPPFAPIDSCNSGTGCWKTALSSGFYSPGVNETIISPAISLAGRSAPIIAEWAQKYQMRDAALDQISVEVRNAGGANPRRLFEHLDGTMTDVAIGNPSLDIDASAGWGIHTSDISSYAGQNVEFRFNLTSSTGAIAQAGFAIDDLSLTECQVTDRIFRDGFQ